MYEQMHTEFRYTLNEVFYNKEYGAWYDWNTKDKQQIGTSDHIVHNFPSVATPLFTGCYDLLDTDKPRQLFKSLLNTGFFNFSGGIPTSLISTNQQWDFPNGWAPTNHQLIEGLRKSANPEMQDKGFEVAMKWIYGNYKVYNSTRKMFEKYDVPGRGGEYAVQTGFGWSNGVILDLLSTYYDRIKAPPSEND
ncbi:Trehalase [Aphelenchoides besseyi]|nr:Trehalase [Aphelenchoides besseyi]